MSAPATAAELPLSLRVSKQWFVKHGAPRRARNRRCSRTARQSLSRNASTKIYFHWMENIQRLVHLPPALVGSPHSCMVLRRLRRDNRSRKDRSDKFARSAAAPICIRIPIRLTHGSPLRSGRSPHSAGRIMTEDLKYFYPDQHAWLRAMTSSSFWVVENDFLRASSTWVRFRSILFSSTDLCATLRAEKCQSPSATASIRLKSSTSTAQMPCASRLPTATAPGNDMRYSDEKVEASRNFANKLWNAARFILMNLDGLREEAGLPDELALEDKWVLSRLQRPRQRGYGQSREDLSSASPCRSSMISSGMFSATGISSLRRFACKRAASPHSAQSACSYMSMSDTS